MEFQVEHVPGKDCHVRLPNSLFQVLSETSLPPVPLFLELCLSGQRKNGTVESRSHKDATKGVRWCVSWSGDLSKSEHLEVSAAFGRCIGLQNMAVVRVRVRKPDEIVAATIVVLEPSSPDDWELLELNRDYLETNIQNQISVLSEEQQIPIWIRGQYITLTTVSCSPQPLVRLVNGSQLSVAPKERPSKREASNKLKNSSSNSSNLQQGKVGNGPKMINAKVVGTVGDGGDVETGAARVKAGRVIARLRVQEIHPSLPQPVSIAEELEALTVPSCCVYVSPITASRLCLSDCQLMYISSPLSRSSGSAAQNSSESFFEADSKKDMSTLTFRSLSNGSPVQIRLWHGVAQGHAMIGYTLRLQVGLELLGQVKLHFCDSISKNPPSSVLLSPLHFKSSLDVPQQHGYENVVASEYGSKPILSWQIHRDLLNAARSETARKKGSEEERGGGAALLTKWVNSQCSLEGMEGEAPLVDGMLLHFKVVLHGVQRIWQDKMLEEGERLTVADNMEDHISEKDNKLEEKHEENDKRKLLSVDMSSAHVREKGTEEIDTYFMLNFEDREGGHGQQLGKQQKKGRNGVGASCTLRAFQESLKEGSVKVQLGKAVLGHLPNSGSKSQLESDGGQVIPSHSWLRPTAESLRIRLVAVLSEKTREMRLRMGTPRPGGLLLTGAQTGEKKKVVYSVAREMREDGECQAYSIAINCAELVGESLKDVQKTLEAYIRQAVEHSPSIVILEDLDALLPASNEMEGGTGQAAIVSYLSDIFDYSQTDSCPPIAFLGLSRSPTTLAEELQVSGRLDHHVELPAPGEKDRLSILRESLEERGLQFSETLLASVAARCQGFDISDVQVLVSRAVHAGSARLLVQLSEREKERKKESDNVNEKGSDDARLNEREIDREKQGEEEGGKGSANGRETWSGASEDGEKLEERQKERETGKRESLGDEKKQDGGDGPVDEKIPKKERLELLEDDFKKAEEGFIPAAMRSVVKTSSTSDKGVSRGWQDVGGLSNVRKALQEILEMPAKHSRLFASAPLRLRSGVLLYGPPGCGKTHIVGSASAACGLRCVSVKGPELLNKYIGASEQAVRDVFAKASMASPCILFFDEFDAIAPKRGHDNTGVTDRVVNQLLTELDGVEGLTGVFVIAATSRPDLIDAALLRPGRLDRLLICGFPEYEERVEILKALSRHLPMAEDVELEEVGRSTDGFSGADLQAVLAEAQLAAVHAVLEGESARENESGGLKAPLITSKHLREAVKAARPSVPERERMRLVTIYDSFLSSKSAAASSKGSKGKRATLA